jgi:transcription initiation factor IIE alpha subunit
MEPEHIFLANQILVLLSRCLLTGKTIKALSLQLEVEEKTVQETLQTLMRESHVVTRDVIIGQQPRTFYLARRQSQIVREIIYENVRGPHLELIERWASAQEEVSSPET